MSFAYRSFFVYQENQFGVDNCISSRSVLVLTALLPMKLIWRIFALGPSATENRICTRLRSTGVTVVVTSAA
ncbi:hypothetical protein AWB69_09330 [Caballeronia udeis]|uniref:Uncharacterized protein n=1 Tax=Caballeronia udeis TaxID=1232866 RepID=A0A158K402_9BURK|nr:hypothetical protein AWB69_09330 [Caballeronia udeis]